MNWQHIKVSENNTHFLLDGKLVFGKKFWEVLKFHAPGLAPVKDKSGAYHIDSEGNQLYSDRYSRTFGYYFNRASVVKDGKWFHINEKGERAYMEVFAWTGNFQEDLCPVRDFEDFYFHIQSDGNRAYSNNFYYCGDFKDGVACAKTLDGNYRHIDPKGHFINEKSFLDLGVFHKNFATAKDQDGWHHIDKNGNQLYFERYAAVEPFYNGFALVTRFDDIKVIIDESGEVILPV